MKGVAFTTVLISLAIASSTSLAQTATPRVDKREAHQQAKIHQGIKSGELTRHEAITLEKQQAKIRRDEKMAKADGVVTPQERARLNRKLDRSSRNIYTKKHNSRTPVRSPSSAVCTSSPGKRLHALLPSKKTVFGLHPGHRSLLHRQFFLSNIFAIVAMSEVGNSQT